MRSDFKKLDSFTLETSSASFCATGVWGLRGKALFRLWVKIRTLILGISFPTMPTILPLLRSSEHWVWKKEKKSENLRFSTTDLIVFLYIFLYSQQDEFGPKMPQVQYYNTKHSTSVMKFSSLSKSYNFARNLDVRNRNESF